MAERDIFAEQPFLSTSPAFAPPTEIKPSAEIKKENYQEKPSFFGNLAQFQMDRAMQNFQKQKAATDITTDVASALYNMTGPQKTYIGLNVLPGASYPDTAGQMAVFPDKTVTMADLPQYMVDAEKYPSLPENLREGNYLDATFQGIGSLFDTALLGAIGLSGPAAPIVSAAGTLIKAPFEALTMIPMLRRAYKAGKIGNVDSKPQPNVSGIDTKGSDFNLPLSKIKFDVGVGGKPIMSNDPDRINLADRLLKIGEEGFTYKGVSANPRQPLEVLKNPDDTYTLLGGKSSFEALSSRGNVDEVPVKVFNSKDNFKIYDFERKKLKNQKRVEDATKVQPKIGNPTFEPPLRQISPKLEYEVANVFTRNNNAGLFSTIDDVELVANEARKIAGSMAKEYVDEIEAVGKRVTDKYFENYKGKKDELFEYTVNPGESIKFEFDVEYPEIQAGVIKQIPRMVEKASQKYNNNIGRITDLLRTRVIAEDTASADLIVQELHKNYKVIDSGFQKNPHGYIDRKLNIVFEAKKGPNAGKSIVAEISIGPSQMQKASEENHHFYEAWRELQTKVKGQKRVKASDRKILNELVEIMQKRFGEAEEKIHPSWKNYFEKY